MCVMYTQTPYRPPGSRQSFCLAWIPLLSLFFFFSPLLPSYPLPPTPLVPKPDIKKGLPKNNMGNFLSSWELYPCWENSQTSLLHSYLPSLYLSIACQQRFGGVTATTTVGDGEVRRVGGGAEVYFFLGASFALSIVCQQRFGGQQQQQGGLWRQEGGETEVWLPSDRPSAEARKGKRGRSGWWRAQGRKGVAHRGEMWDVENMDQDKLSAQLYLRAIEESELLLAIWEALRLVWYRNKETARWRMVSIF